MENKVSIGTRLKAAGKNTVSSYGSVLIAVISLVVCFTVFPHGGKLQKHRRLYVCLRYYCGRRDGVDAAGRS